MITNIMIAIDATDYHCDCHHLMVPGNHKHWKHIKLEMLKTNKDIKILHLTSFYNLIFLVTME